MAKDRSGNLDDGSRDGLVVKRAFANVAAAQTDAALVTAVAAKKIRVLGVILSGAGAGATSVTFNSKPAGSGVAISPAFLSHAVGPVLPYNPHGWFETVAGEGLTVTTGAGTTTGILILYVEA